MSAGERAGGHGRRVRESGQPRSAAPPLQQGLSSTVPSSPSSEALHVSQQGVISTRSPGTVLPPAACRRHGGHSAEGSLAVRSLCWPPSARGTGPTAVPAPSSPLDSPDTANRAQWAAEPPRSPRGLTWTLRCLLDLVSPAGCREHKWRCLPFGEAASPRPLAILKAATVLTAQQAGGQGGATSSKLGHRDCGSNRWTYDPRQASPKPPLRFPRPDLRS